MSDAPSSDTAGRGNGHGRGRAPADSRGRETLELDVPEMDCPSCVGAVGGALDCVDGVVAYDLRPTTGRAVVAYDPAAADAAAVVAAVERAGYEVVSPVDDAPAGAADGERSSVWTGARARKTGVSAGFLALGLLIEYLFPGANVAVADLLGRRFLLSDVLFFVGIAVGGEVIVRNGYRSARNRSLDMDFLMSAAILAATGASLVAGVDLYVEAASLAVLFNVAELLERHSVDRARRSLEALASLAPETAVVRRGGERVEVPADEVAVGEVVIAEPGARIPVDGVVVEGESAVDQSPITGESVPVEKAAGDEVFAGTVNEGGYLEVEATATSGDSTLARVVELVEDAEAKRTEREQFVERFAGYYTPAVVAAAVVTAVVPPLLGAPWQPWFLRGIAFLVIACPCAFVISTPVTVVSGITSAARNGVLIKGGTHLEAAGEVAVVAFDKTGTLTEGELEVTDVVPLNGNTEADVLRCASGLERRSEHPIAAAIVDRAADLDGERAVEGFERLAGRGVRAELDGRAHYAGGPELFDELGFDLEHVHFTTGTGELPSEARERCARAGCLDLVADTVPRLQAEGKTAVLVGTDEELEGVIAVADTVRPEARRAVGALRERGVRTVMLTGDNEGTARAVADAVGVDEYRAGLLPGEKVAAVEDLEREGTVAMVGDGVNDAPALAAATVGVAMGAAGTDTALETADVALMGDDLSKLPYLYELSRTANGVVRQNVWSSLGVKALLAVGIPLGYVSVVLAVLAGDVGMTTLVTANALRLSRIDPRDLLA